MANNILFDLLAPLYDWAIGQRDLREITALLELPTPGRLLDLGGGTGRNAVQLQVQARQLVLSDLSHSMLTQAKAKGLQILLQSSSSRLPFPDDCYERILVVDALHHFSDQQQALREMVRILKPGGILLIEEPDIRRFPVKLIAVAEILALMGSHIHRPDDIKALLETCGVSAEVREDSAGSVYVRVRK
ncbi:MAG: class I SAM-dependent methyltransferase [Anaerolineales bacterium]|nr:class I SAM-dependent methyltransferase [Anaerolineales bacterium]